MPSQPHSFRAEALVLRHSDWGEADRLLTLFTRELGKVRAIAKGVRKIRSRKAGHLEPFTRVSLQLARGRDLLIVTQAETVDAYLPLGESLVLTGYASYVIELLDRFTYEEGENRALYSLLTDTLARLAAGDAAMATALARGHATATLTPSPIAAGATVSVVYRPGTADAWLVGDGLPATPAGDVYQLWAADLAGVHPLTTFTCDGTSPCIASYGADLASARATMITLEPGGGSRGEPGPQVAFGKLQG
jgi:hypothetical protein